MANTDSGVAKTYARLRPFVDPEGSTPFEGQHVARPVVDATPQELNTVRILDPSAKFKPKKDFAFTKLFWQSPDGDLTDPMPQCSSKDLGSTVVRDMVKKAANGFNTAVCVCGAAKSGKKSALFGDMSGDSAGPHLGVFPLFAHAIFRGLKTEKSASTTVTLELEVLDVDDQGAALADLHLKKGDKKEDLKIREDADGLVVQGASRVPAPDAATMISTVRQALTRFVKRGGPVSHLIVNVHLKETLSFADPADAKQTITKTGKSVTSFALLNGRPTAFFRCVDCCMQGKKPPTRESTLTRLLSQFFGGNCAPHFIGCFSPFHGQLKETMQMLDFVTRMSNIKYTVKSSYDQETSEFRRLDNEVKQLRKKIKSATEAQAAVQDELDRRQTELEKVSARHDQHQEAYRAAKEEEETEVAVLAAKQARLRLATQTQKQEQSDARGRVKAQRDKIKRLRKEAEELKKDVAAIQEATEVDYRKAEPQLTAFADLRAKVVVFEEAHEDCAKGTQPAADALKKLEADSAAEVGAMEKEMAAIRAELATVTITADAAAAERAKAQAKHDVEYEWKNRYDKAVATEAAFKQEEQDLRRETEELRTEIARLEAEEKATGGCCSVM